MSWVDDQNIHNDKNSQYGITPYQNNQDGTPSSLGGGEIAGIVVGCVLFVGMMLAICCRTRKRCQVRLNDERPLVTNNTTTSSMQRLPTQGSTEVAIQPGDRLAAARPDAPSPRGAIGLIIVRRIFCIISVARPKPAVPVLPPPYETLVSVTPERAFIESDAPPPYKERY